LGNDRRGDVIEVRLLGPLSVRRGDGSVVDLSEWRTRKTADLLRILALRAGETVPVAELVDILWPHVEAERGRASLRTAASQIRRVLRRSCIGRSFGALVLQDVWTDTHTFSMLVRESARAGLVGSNEQAVAAARQADALYLGDLDVGPDDTPEWLRVEGERLRRAHLDLLVNAANAAVSLSWMRDGLDFAERALVDDPYSEGAYRAAMLAYAGLGEMQRALSVYERCKTRLADELGVDPSSQTHAVYLQVLRMPPPPEVASPFIGRGAEIAQAHQRLHELSGGQGGVLLITGVPTGGAGRLVDEVVAQLDNPVQRPAATAEVDAILPLDPEPGTVVVVHGVQAWPSGALRQLAERVRDSAQSYTLLASYCTDAAGEAELDSLVHDALVERIDLDPLSSSQVEELVRLLVGGQPTAELVETVLTLSSGHPGAVVSTVRDWIAHGRLVHTGRGMDLTAETGQAAVSTGAQRRLRSLHHRLTARELAVLDVVAVVGTGVTADAIITCLDADRDEQVPSSLTSVEIIALLSRLEDLVVVSVDQSGRFIFRDPLLRDATRAWLRPTARRGLHRTVASRLALPAATRVGHWLEAGEGRLACAAALEAADEAMAGHHFADALMLLQRVERLIDEDTSTPQDRVDLLTKLAVCAGELGKAHEALEYRDKGRSLAASVGLEEPQEAAPVRPSTVTVLSPRRGLAERLHLLPTTSPTPELEWLLRRAMNDADEQQHLVDGFDARLLLACLVCVPRRRLAEAHALAVHVRTRSPVSEQRTLGVLIEQESAVLLGGPGYDLEQLDMAAQALPGLTSLTTCLPVGVLCALARHQHALPDASAMLDSVAATIRPAEAEGSWPWVVAGMMAELGRTTAARALISGRPWRAGTPTGQTLALLGKSQLELAEGDLAAAAVTLRRGFDSAQRSGATLMLPEIAARLALLGGDEDDGWKEEYLDLAESALGEAVFGRERVALTLARAAVRAGTGDLLGAAEMAAAAAGLARALNLPHRAAQALRQREAYLRAATSRLGSPPAADPHRVESPLRAVLSAGSVPIQRTPERRARWKDRRTATNQSWAANVASREDRDVSAGEEN